MLSSGYTRVVHGSIFCDPTQPNPSIDRPNPTRPTASWKISTQPNPTQLNPILPNLNLYPVIKVCNILNCLRQQAAKLEMSDLIMQSSTTIKSIYLRRNATQPNPPQVEKSRPNPTQPNPTQPMDWPNPWTTLGYTTMTAFPVCKKT